MAGPLKFVNGVARIVCVGASAGVPIVNVFHVANGFPSPIPYDNAGIQSLVNSFATSFKSRMLPLTSTAYLGDTATAIDLSTDIGATASALINITGSGSGTNTPQSACVCIGWKTARHYRGGHGRTYMGPLAGTSIGTTTNLATAFITTASTNANLFLTEINALTIAGQQQKLVIVHRVKNGVVLDVPLVDAVTSATVDSRIDTQRRRLGKDR
jgi:hypothetical protein